MAQVIGQGLQIAGLFTGNVWLTLAGSALRAGDAYEQNRRARSQARTRFNESLTDRLEMFDRQPDQARTMALGRVRTVEGIRRKWVSGTNSEKLTMVISFAGHEIDAFETFYFNEVPLTLDGSGYVTTEPYAKSRAESYSSGSQALSGGGGSVVLAHTPTSGTVEAVYFIGAPEDGNQGPLTIDSIVGATVTVSGAPVGASTFVVLYQVGTTTSTARIRYWTGAPGQDVGGDIAADYPAQTWLADAQFAGMAVAVVDITYDPDVYPQGRPNVTALLRGAKCYDPRLDSTAGGSGSHRLNNETTWAWTENPALHAVRYAMWPYGWGLEADDWRVADVVEAANFADTSTDFTVRMPDTSTTDITLPRYRCGIVIASDSDPREAMQGILGSMAGRHGWDGGVWRFKAGMMPASVFDMDQTWLARPTVDGKPTGEPTLQFVNGIPRDQKVNRVAGKCVDSAQRYQVLPFPAVEDATLIAAEGQTYTLDVVYPGVNHYAHAQHLASIAIRRAQAPLVITASCNMNPFEAELFDVCELTLPSYSIASKTMEVVGLRRGFSENTLRLQEITDAIFEVDDELTGRDPAPNSGLPQPWEVDTLTGLTVDSGTAILADSSIIVRALVEWDASTQQSVRAGGHVQIEYAEAGDELVWQRWEEGGSNTSATIPGPKAGFTYVFRARFLSAAPFAVAGDWSEQVAHQMATQPLVQTGGIEPGAATQVPTPLSVSAMSITGELSGSGTTDYTDTAQWTEVGTFSWTAETDGDAYLNLNAKLSFEADSVSAGLVLAANINIDFDNDDLAETGDEFLKESLFVVPRGGGPDMFGSKTAIIRKKRTVIGGTTYTWPVYAQNVPPAGGVYLSYLTLDLEFGVELIKR